MNKVKIIFYILIIAFSISLFDYKIYAATIYTDSYTGGTITFTVPNTGIYKLEVWGA